jgi:MoaA/NifB/PqqE/SkfB family radical SAM enzyme
MYTIVETKDIKRLQSPQCNYIFNKINGTMISWGATEDDNPTDCPYGPWIVDLEISINGCPNNCSFCYKQNTSAPATNMSLETFKKIIDKLPRTVTQIALGITGAQTNPHFVDMLKYCREKQIVPNFTLSGIDLTEQLADEFVKHVGAVAVSCYQTDKNVCYDTVQMFTQRGLQQTNIHLMVSEQTEQFVYEVLKDLKSDKRVEKLNAVVFLAVKPKGRAKDSFTPLSTERYQKLVEYCLENQIQFGFDSCSAGKYEAAINNSSILSDQDKKQMISYSESCESSLFSAYINVKGQYWHCSFSEDETTQQGIDVVNANNFVNDVWNHPTVVKFRNELIETTKDGCRKCLMFPEINK